MRKRLYWHMIPQHLIDRVEAIKNPDNPKRLYDLKRFMRNKHGRKHIPFGLIVSELEYFERGNESDG